MLAVSELQVLAGVKILRGDLACTRFWPLAASGSLVLSAGLAFLGARYVQGSLVSFAEYGASVCVCACVQDAVMHFNEQRLRAFHALYLALLQRSSS